MRSIDVLLLRVEAVRTAERYSVLMRYKIGWEHILLVALVALGFAVRRYKVI